MTLITFTLEAFDEDNEAEVLLSCEADFRHDPVSGETDLRDIQVELSDPWPMIGRDKESTNAWLDRYLKDHWSEAEEAANLAFGNYEPPERY